MKIQVLWYVLGIFFGSCCMQQILCNNITADIHSYQYDVCYKDYAIKNDQEAAVLVVAYNRPDYFIQCIKSIEQNTESQSLTFIFALDGGKNSTQEENLALINQSAIKNKIILLRNRNYGCPKNHIDSKRFVFEWCKFKKVIILEDDLVISPYYFTFLLNFHTWATTKYSNIGAVQGWTFCFLPAEQKKEIIQNVQENSRYWSFVTYCIDSTCWQKIRGVLYGFENFVDQIPLTDDYTRERSKPCYWQGMKQIREWVRSLVRAKPKQKKAASASCFVSKLNLMGHFFSPRFLAHQDVMMGFSFYINDLVKLHSCVNRVIHIGQRGITSDPESYKDHYGNMRLDVFEEDKTLVSFREM